ncbi:alpha/beta fold hydrolase [Trueperella bialowiezensis]|uniref:2-hydroxy-6-oxo-6-phenylhexa-2,4-dienoate hydrolase n=1 Tax=Trueperella bialowiezensis TaxID=312285 RepID=A0A3S4X5F6_9ACTO|nr:alpha/beta hydrolase [Trueperella bialowiezensis]VEI13076.1 2-hydroxy-6-oxo-6-phenylhexa-2,4-dienoate hydrolase [Trueperella bialowiezensis]
MTTVAFVHGHATSPQSWRDVADNRPAHWAVVAPNFFARAAGGGVSGAGSPGVEGIPAGELAAQINQDLAQLGIGEPVVVVAEGAGAIVAIRYALDFPERVGGLVVSGPRLYLRGADVVAMRAASRFGKNGGATREQTRDYLAALKGVDVREQAAEVTVPKRVLAAENDRPSRADSRQLRAAGWDFTLVPEAEWDWFTYAPAAFAAHITRFVGEHEL